MSGKSFYFIVDKLYIYMKKNQQYKASTVVRYLKNCQPQNLSSFELKYSFLLVLLFYTQGHFLVGLLTWRWKWTFIRRYIIIVRIVYVYKENCRRLYIVIFISVIDIIISKNYKQTSIGLSIHIIILIKLKWFLKHDLTFW